MSTANARRRRYCFGRFTLDTAKGTLRNDATEIRLRPQSFDVLCYLVENHGRLVPKAELMDAIWGNTVVTDGSLTHCLIDIRKALGDSSREIVRTVPRRGFIFDESLEDVGATVETHPAGSPSRRVQGWQSRMLIGTLVVAGLAAVLWWAFASRERTPVDDHAVERHAIAVLPFVDMSETGGHEYFSDGIAEEILNLLTRVPGLQVIARTSSFSFRNTGADIVTIADKLNVTHVLEGSVRRAGNRVRITVQLVDAQNGVHLWSQTYDREWHDILSLQSEIAAAVTNALNATIADIPSPRPEFPMDAAAHERYLQAGYFHNRRAPGDLERAEDYYRQALEIHSGYAEAWAGLAGVLIIFYDSRDSSDARLEALRQAVDQALAYDPALAAAHIRAASYYGYAGDPAARRQHQRRAEALNPDNPLVLGHMAGVADCEGRIADAIERQERSVRLNPLSHTDRMRLAAFLAAVGRFEPAKAELARALEFRPGSRAASLEMGLILIAQGKFEAGLRLVRPAPDGVVKEKGLVLALLGLGRDAEADAVLRRLLASMESGAARNVADVYAWRGDVQTAFSWLEADLSAAAADHLIGQRRSYVEIRLSPFLASLRDDPRWEELLATQVC